MIDIDAAIESLRVAIPDLLRDGGHDDAVADCVAIAEWLTNVARHVRGLKLAGEQLNAGDFVCIGLDGLIYRHRHSNDNHPIGWVPRPFAADHLVSVIERASFPGPSSSHPG